MIFAFDQLCRDSIVVYDDDEVEGRFLSLDELGAVLRQLSETLPGIYCLKFIMKQAILKIDLNFAL